MSHTIAVGAGNVYVEPIRHSFQAGLGIWWSISDYVVTDLMQWANQSTLMFYLRLQYPI